METPNKINKMNQTNINFNRVKNPEQKKYTKEQIRRHRKYGAGILATIIATGGFMVGRHEENITNNLETAKNSIASIGKTVDYNKNEAPIDALSTNGLDNENIDLTNYEKITLGNDIEITLNEGDPVRSTDKSYVGKNPEDSGPNHSSIFIAKENINFTIKEGDTIYQNEDGQIVTKIDNFTQTTDGLETGLRTDIDKDGWVFVDTPNQINKDKE